MTYISTLSLTAPLQTSVLQAQAALSTAQTEVASGAPADIGLTLGGQTGTELSMKSQIDELNGYSDSNGVVAPRLSATSTALTSLLSSAQTIASDLTTAASAGGSTTTLQTSGTDALQALISGLNTTVGGESVFGGINTSATPIADYFSTQTSTAKQAVDSAFTEAFGTSQTSTDASTITGTQMQSFLSNQFASLFDSSNWQSDWSSASSTTMQSAISPTQTTTSSVSANETAFSQIAEAYTMVSEFTGSNLSSSAQSAVVSTATTLLNSGIAALTNLQTNVGVAQSAVDDANTQLTAQVSVLQTNVSNLDSVDTYALSTQVTNLQDQLEASYELTSRLQDLTLTNYLSS